MRSIMNGVGEQSYYNIANNIIDSKKAPHILCVCVCMSLWCMCVTWNPVNLVHMTRSTQCDDCMINTFLDGLCLQIFRIMSILVREPELNDFTSELILCRLCLWRMARILMLYVKGLCPWQGKLYRFHELYSCQICFFVLSFSISVILLTQMCMGSAGGI